MAYLDDNNDNLYTQGDPLEDLDKELAELRATLEELDGSAPDAQASDGNASKEEKTVLQEPDPPSDKQKPKTTEETGEDMKQKSSGHGNSSANKPSGKHRVPVIIAAILLSAALIIGAGWGVSRLLQPKNVNENGNPVADGEKVTINDSVMGDIELQTVKGAEINTYTAENLVTDENGIPAYYEDGKKISRLGADLSEYQGEVDFAAMKKAGVEFVMLRVGGRYYGDSSGVYEDKLFESNYEAAKAAGLKVGAYFFSQANCTEDAKEEAEFTLQKISGKQLDYPVAFDWENIADDAARTDEVTGDQLTVLAETFCDTITEAGHKAIVYSNTQQMFVMYDFETMKDYDFWLADYRDFPTMYYRFDMWQYTKDGTIDGVEGAVDLNLSFTDFSE